MTQSVPEISIDRCFLCDKKSDNVIWHENDFDGRLCADCYTLYTDTAGKIVLTPDMASELHPDAFYTGPARLKASWMAKRVPKGRLLEIGCGEPTFLEEARNLGFDIAAMEPHPGRAKRVSERLDIPVHQGFIEEDRLEPHSFDIVYQCDLLAHFPDPLLAIRSMIRLLKPGGVLCFEVGTLGGISPFWYRQIRRIDLGQHLFLYSRRSLSMLLERAQLDVLHRTEYGLAPEVLSNVPVAICARLIRLFSRASAQRFREGATCFFRYRVGRLAPGFGPGTYFFVARPRGEYA